MIFKKLNFRFLKWIKRTPFPLIKLDKETIKSKSSKELIDILENIEYLSYPSGQRIFTELLKRLVESEN